MRGAYFCFLVIFIWSLVEGGESAETCKKTFTNEDTGNFTSPNYPSPFGNSDCEWTITVESGNTIQIKFLEFDIKSDGDSSCGSNRLEIGTGLDFDIYCNINPVSTYNSTTNTIQVLFKATGNSANSKGFSAEFITIKPTTTSAPTTTPQPTTTATATTTNSTTAATPKNATTTSATTKGPDDGKKSSGGLSEGAIAGISIVVILVVFLVIDFILYQFKTGVTYNIKQRCS